MNMILIKPSEIDVDNRTVLSDRRFEHIRHVLRAAPGMSLRIGLLNGPFGIGLVERIDGKSVLLKCSFETEPPPRPRIDLLLAMPRPKVLKRLWAQLAALGVGRIVLLRTSKVERCYFDSHVLEPGFYTELLVEGLQQARCTHLPEVMIRPLFKPFIEDELDALFSSHLKMLADPSSDRLMGDVILSADSPSRVALAIGPEGGWTSYECEVLKKHGFQRFSLGERILRTDTATIALIATLMEYLRKTDRGRA